MRWRSLALAIVSMSALGAACSGSSGGGGSGGYSPNPALCEASCSAMTQAGCNAAPPSECQAECEETREKFAECLVEVDALLTCGNQNGYSCSSGSAGPTGCEAEFEALSLCGACIPTGSNGPCTICAKKSCCAEYKAFGNAPDLMSYQSCIQSCSTIECLEACDAANPTAAAAFHAVDECRSTKCPTACDGKPSDLPTDPVGRFCSAAAKAGCPLENCGSNFSQSSDATGCGPELYQALECAAAAPVTCEGGSPVFDESCLAPYQQCIGATVGSGGGTTSNSGGSGGSGGGALVGGSGGSGVGGAMVGGSGGG